MRTRLCLVCLALLVAGCDPRVATDEQGQMSLTFAKRDPRDDMAQVQATTVELASRVCDDMGKLTLKVVAHESFRNDPMTHLPGNRIVFRCE
jgi:hypothetical protein